MKTLLLTIILLLNISAKSLEDEKKLVLVYIEMEFCPWCVKMDRETLDNEAALKKIKEHFLVAKIKKESGNMPLFLNPQYSPTTYILSPDGSKIIDELPGYMEKKRYLDYLQLLYEVENGIE